MPCMSNPSISNRSFFAWAFSAACSTMKDWWSATNLGPSPPKIDAMTSPAASRDPAAIRLKISSTLALESFHGFRVWKRSDSAKTPDIEWKMNFEKPLTWFEMNSMSGSQPNLLAVNFFHLQFPRLQWQMAPFPPNLTGIQPRSHALIVKLVPIGYKPSIPA